MEGSQETCLCVESQICGSWIFFLANFFIFTFVYALETYRSISNLYCRCRFSFWRISIEPEEKSVSPFSGRQKRADDRKYVKMINKKEI